MNIIKLLVIVFLAGILIQTTDSAFNTISAVSLDKVDGHSRVIMTFTHPATYSIEPDIGKKVIKLLFPQCSIDPSISTLGLTNSRVEKIGLQTLDESNSAAEIYLRDTATSVYHSLSRDGKILTLRFKSRKSLLAITTDPMIRKKRLTKKEAERHLQRKWRTLVKPPVKNSFGTP